MSRYADPLRCPECRAHLAPASAACPTCGLPLRGEVAGRLYVTLRHADELLDALRAQQLAAGGPAAAGPRAGSVPTAPLVGGTAALPRFSGNPGSATPPADLPGYLARQLSPRRARLSALSVPRILLGLGALCLVVAAVVFLAVTWSVLGVAGRTAVLVGLTLVSGGLAAGLARSEVRAAAEALALVAYGLLTLDLVGADHAGWLGDLSGPGLARLAGGVLVVTGAAGALAARRWTTGGTLLGAEVVAAVGTAVAATGVCADHRLSLSVALVAGVPLSAAATAAVHAVRLRTATRWSAAATIAVWLLLAAHGLQVSIEAGDAGGGGWHRLWLQGQVWPLLAAAALAVLPAAVPRVPTGWRVASLALVLALLTAAALAPTFGRSTTVVSLVALGVLAGCGAGARLLPRPWGLVTLLDQLVAGGVVLTVGGALVARSVPRVDAAVGGVWSGRTADVLPPALPWLPAGWLLPLCAVGLIGTALALASASATVERALAPLRDVRWAVVVLAAAATAGAALFPVPLWTLTAAGLALAACFTVAWLRRPSVGSLSVVAGSLAVAGLLALHAEALTAGAAAATTAGAAVVQLRSRDGRHAAGAGAVLAVALAGLVWTCCWWCHVPHALAATVGVAGLVALALLAPYSPPRWWAADRPALARAGSEVAAAGVGAALTAAGIALAPPGAHATWAAVLLTVGGAGVTAMSLLRRDRAWLRPVGGLLLVAATWVRLWDLGVTAPEAYTLPTAVVLLAIGLHRLRGRDDTTVEALSPGLFLALTPSLLWVLGQPTGPRAALLGLACLVSVLVGARLGWTAPLAAGATVGALLVLRLAAPYVEEAVPRWVLIGTAGALLVAVGATWERRLTEATALLGYVRRLR